MQTPNSLPKWKKEVLKNQLVCVLERERENMPTIIKCIKCKKNQQINEKMWYKNKGYCCFCYYEKFKKYD